MSNESKFVVVYGNMKPEMVGAVVDVLPENVYPTFSTARHGAKCMQGRTFIARAELVEGNSYRIITLRGSH